MKTATRRHTVARAAGAAVAIAAALGAVAVADAADVIATASVDEPRAFGYSVGDVVARRVVIDVPSGLTLDPASLPQPGRRGRALELRSVALKSRLGGRRHELWLEYQVFLSPPEVRTLEMPPFTLRFQGMPREQNVRVDAWPVSVSPLVAADAPSRRGLGEMQPDAGPPLIDTGAVRLRVAVVAALLAALLAYLAHVYIAVPWWARRRRPFGVAWRQLRGLPDRPSADQRRAAFGQVHEALNLTAGEVLFEPRIDRFLAAHPRFAPLRGELASFFERSRREFFAGCPADGAAGDWDALLLFCRSCRDAERGAA